MNDTMSLLLATTILAAGGLGLYMYKSSDNNQKGGDDDYDEGTLFGSGSLWGSNEDENLEENSENEEVYYAKPRTKQGKTKRRKTSGGTKRRY